MYINSYNNILNFWFSNNNYNNFWFDELVDEYLEHYYIRILIIILILMILIMNIMNTMKKSIF
jgi:hypothetical protein